MAACAVTLGIVAVILRSAPRSDLRQRTEARLERDARAAPPRVGVTAALAAGEVTVSRSLPALAFALAEGQTLDPRLPAGPFDAVLDVTFRRGAVRQAWLGAELRGGQLIVRRGDEVLLSDFAGDERRLVMTTLPVALGRPVQRLTYEFRGRAAGPRALRAMWRPVDAEAALPLPSEGSPLVDRTALRGLVLAQQLNCARCHHVADDAARARLEASPAPVLGDAGGRLRPAWIRRWLRDPAALDARAPMPALLDDADDERLEDLVHFLVSMGGPAEGASAAPDASLVATGRDLYRRVGCVPCHGPGEAGETDAIGAAATFLARAGTLDDVPAKTTGPALVAFLLDPLRWRPGGRMPSMSLTPIEAEAIAAYLLRDAAPAGDPAPLAPDPARIERGRTAFAEVGCAACHALGPDRTPIASRRAAPPLASLPATAAGCLDPTPAPGVPRYALRPAERDALVALLAELPAHTGADAPLDRLAATVRRLDCTACHAFHAERGPDPALARFFETEGEADLGDEGRIPPDLTDVGAKLNRPWLAEVLEAGGRARPYLATRMPQYGPANVAAVPDLLAAVAGAVPGAAPADPACPAELASIGRQLVGSAAFNCIQCHTIAGRDATGTPGPDLARMPARLRYASFRRWLHDPARLRPGTRMPSFFVAGRSGFTDLLGGDAERQIEAMWCYLSQGEFLPLPEGLADPGGLTLDVDAEPIVFRTYMAAAGVRAIACGFPAQVHCAFDGDRCRLALVWEGRFLDASGAWAARGGSETNPERVVWTAPDAPLVRLDEGTDERRFRGYRLDDGGRPTFLYDLGAGETRVQVRERPDPVVDGDGPRLRRRLELTGPPGRGVRVDPGAGDLARGAGAWTERPDGGWRLELGPDGRADFSVEVRW
ncbi:MAG: hypothetical protein ACYTG1_04125 [Planctomycetota bacterium]